MEIESHDPLRGGSINLARHHHDTSTYCNSKPMTTVAWVEIAVGGMNLCVWEDGGWQLS
jgi:hypothetical protein